VQENGNVVLRKVHHWNHIWQSHTHRYRNYQPFRFVLQDDCNLVLFDKDNTVRWASGTDQVPKQVRINSTTTVQVPWKSELKLQDDGNLILYREDGLVLWATNTAGRKDTSAGHSTLTAQGADGVLLKRAVSGEEEGSTEGERWAADKQQDDWDAARDKDENQSGDREDEDADEEEGHADDEKIANSAGDDDGAAPRSQLHGSFKETYGELPFVERSGEMGPTRKQVDGGRTRKRIDQAATGSVSPVQEVIDSLI